MHPRGNSAGAQTIGPEGSGASGGFNPFQIHNVRPNAVGGTDYYQGASTGIGPALAAACTLFFVGRYGALINQTFVGRSDPGLGAANGFWSLSTDGAQALSWTVSGGGALVVSTTISLISPLQRNKFFTSVARVTGGNLEHYFNGSLLGSVATGAINVSTGTNRLTGLIRMDLAAASGCPRDSGIVGFGGVGNAAATANEIADWHEACVDQFACAPFPGETIRYDARDAGATWAPRIGSGTMNENGTVRNIDCVPVWGG